MVMVMIVDDEVVVDDADVDAHADAAAIVAECCQWRCDFRIYLPKTQMKQMQT